MNKQQAYNRIAQATIKALREQAEAGSIQNDSTEKVYQMIDQAFSAEYAKLFSYIEEAKTALQFIANGNELDKDQMIKLAQQSLTKLK